MNCAYNMEAEDNATLVRANGVIRSTVELSRRTTLTFLSLTNDDGSNLR